MSRSGYSDDCEDIGLWRGAVQSATFGKRGQKFLSDLLVALDAMQDKRLIADELVTADGSYCAIGVLGAARGLDMTKLDPEDRYAVADAFNIAPALAAEIVFENDERWTLDNSPENRWIRMRQWVSDQILKGQP